jgi:hypothetical protein
MLEAIAATLPLFFGTALLWMGFNMTRFLTRLARPARPPGFVALHITAIWSVGIASTLCGVTLILQGIALLETAG